MDFPLHLIPLIPLCAAAVNLLIGRRLPRDASSLIAVGSVGAACLLGAIAFWRMAGGESVAALHDHWFVWIETGAFKAEAAFLMDQLSGIMTLVVTFVGLLIHIYSIGYMAHERDYARYFGYLNLFTGAMLVLVLADNLLASFVGWEGVGVCSYLLIGFWYDKEANASAGRKAFIVNRIGDFGFLLGIFLLYLVAGTLNYHELSQKTDVLRSTKLAFQWNAGMWGALLLFIGATGKSAQLPLYVWLPDAMAGPTPVSALIHAATMVTAGVYMVVRLSFLYAVVPGSVAPQIGGLVMVVGCLTALFAAAMAFAQTDIKKVLAYSTISQLGFMFVGAAGSVPSSGVFHLMTHAFFKAGLFLGAGSVMHAMSDRTDIREMGGLRRRLPITHATFLTFTLAIAGMPPLAGFWSKDAILGSAAGLHINARGWHEFGVAIAVIMLVVAAMTSFYMFRLYFLVFTGESRADEQVRSHIHESPAVMTIPLGVLGLLSIVGGLVGTPFHDLFGDFLGAQPETRIPWVNILLGSGAFLVGLGGAWACYANGERAFPRRFAASFPRLYRTVRDKFYVDEIYDWAFVRPLKVVASAVTNAFDRFLIDGVLVNGSARLVDGVGYLVRRVQNGDVQRYVAVMVLGAGAVVWFISRPPTDFNATLQGNRVTVKANPWVHARKLNYCWKVDGGSCLSEKSEATFEVPPGIHRLTLQVDDPLWGTSSSASKDVKGS
jgi:NADH-quinone oxidoreductase subunit L